jgi:hypothetical protein
MSDGRLPAVIPAGNSVIAPVGAIRPTLLPSRSVNQTLPSEPAVIPRGIALAVGMVNSLIVPFGVMRPILFTAVLDESQIAIGPGRYSRQSGVI